MLDRLRAYLRPKTPYDDALIDRRARVLMLYLVVGFIVLLITSIIIAIQSINELASGVEQAFTTPDVILIIFPSFMLINFWLVRNGYYRAGALLLVFVQIGGIASGWNTVITPEIAIALAIPIITAGLLLDWRMTIIVAIIMSVIVGGTTLLVEEPIARFATLLLIIFFLSSLSIAFGSNLQTLTTSFGQELFKLQDVMDVVLNTSQASTENRAALNTINILRDQLGFTFVRIYMVENDEIIERIQSGLNPSQVNVDKFVELGQRSGIYEAIKNKNAVMLPENADPLMRQHLLQVTKTAVAFPILDRNGDVMAVLDVQSDEASFDSVVVQSIGLVGTQFGQTLQTLRIVDDLQRDLAEQDSLIARQRERLLQYETSERQTTTDTWRGYLQQQGVDYLGYDLDDYNAEIIESSELSEDIQHAIQTGEITIEQDGNQQLVSVPINLRGQTLGAMTFKVAQGTQIVGARQQELIRNVVQRLSLALENKRLFEQSQSQARRESTANEVGNLLLTSTDINTVLELAAENFNQALGAIQTQIRLKPNIEQIGEGEVNS